MTSLPVPRVVTHADCKTRYSLIVKEDNEHVDMLTRENGVIDAVRVSATRINANYPAVDEDNLVGKVRPTVAHFLDVLSHSHLDVTPNAVQLLKELSAMKTAIISNTGRIIDAATASSIILSGAKALDANVALVTEKLGERALGAFITNVSQLEKPVARVKKNDRRIAQAVEAALQSAPDIVGADNAKHALDTRAANETTKAAASSTTKTGKKVTTAKKAKKGGGVKVKLHEFFTAGKKGTLATLVKHCDSNDVTVRTAISDLRSPKYGVNGKALNIVKDDDGVYSVKCK